jgi:MFS family permease
MEKKTHAGSGAPSARHATQLSVLQRSEKSNMLFNFLLLANFLQYLEAGAVPALLLSISSSFHMNSAHQGLLGGVVYLSLGAGGPFAGYLLRRFEHKRVVVCAVAANMLFTFLWAMTPVKLTYSTTIFIVMRFMMGLCQCIICVFLPLWTNENAPRKKRTTWMSYLQVFASFRAEDFILFC